MEGLADLHLHSLYSDGLLSPEQLVKQAYSRGIQAMSLTDHDSVEGIAEARAAAQSLDMDFIPGVELSATYKNLDMHVLGYFVDTENASFLQFLERFQQGRYERAEKMVRRLRDQGLAINFEDVVEIAGPGPIGRPHVAEVLARTGQVSSFDHAFFYYIGRHCPAYVKKIEISPEQAAEIVHQASGLAVLAHPLVGPQTRKDVTEMLDAGLDGLEVLHPKLTKADSQWLKSVAEKEGLLVTGGSDYHGEKRSTMELGQFQVPLDFAKQLKQAHRDMPGTQTVNLKSRN